MKDKFKLGKKSRGCAISNIYDPVVKVAMQILARKVMQNYPADEVSTPIVTLA